MKYYSPGYYKSDVSGDIIVFKIHEDQTATVYSRTFNDGIILPYVMQPITISTWFNYPGAKVQILTKEEAFLEVL